MSEDAVSQCQHVLSKTNRPGCLAFALGSDDEIHAKTSGAGNSRVLDPESHFRDLENGKNKKLKLAPTSGPHSALIWHCRAGSGFGEAEKARIPPEPRLELSAVPAHQPSDVRCETVDAPAQPWASCRLRANP